MIYTSAAKSELCVNCRILACTMPTARKPSVRNLSLIFGSSIVRGICPHQCSRTLPGINIVNRLWYGRALVSLRTHTQTSKRAHAIQQQSLSILITEAIQSHANLSS